MIERTFDIITEEGTIARDVKADKVLDIVNMIMDKGYTSSVVLFDHIHENK